MTELPLHVEQMLADLDEASFDALVLRVRSPEELSDPKARAARALAKAVGGGPKPATTRSKEQAAAALARYREANR